MDYKHQCLLEVVNIQEPRFKIINVSSRHPRTRYFFRSVGSVQREQRRHAQSPYSYIIHPLSVFRYYWELTFAILIYISLIMVPFNFYLSVDINRVELTFDFFCIIDIIVSFLTGICIPSISEVVTQPERISSMRLRSATFYVECISSIPDDLLARCIGKVTDGGTRVVDVVLSVLPMLKVMRCFKFLQYYNNITDRVEYIYTRLFFKYFLMIIVAFHWLTCLYIYVVTFDYIFYPELEIHILSFEGLHVEGHTPLNMYVSAVYIVASYLLALNLVSSNLKTVSYDFFKFGDILLFVTISIIGFIFCSVLTAYILQIMEDFNDSHRRYYEVIEAVKQYSASRNLSLTIRERMLTYYEYRFRQMYFEEKQILRLMSDALRKDIFLHSCRPLIENVTILKDLPEDVIADVISSLHHEVYLYNDIIVKAGSTGDCMYFIASGTVAVSTATGKEICHLQDGGFFGEIALISKNHRRIATVVAIEICEVYRLNRRDFRFCFSKNTAYYAKIKQIALERIGKTTLLDELHRKYIMDKTRRIHLS